MCSEVNKLKSKQKINVFIHVVSYVAWWTSLIKLLGILSLKIVVIVVYLYY